MSAAPPDLTVTVEERGRPRRAQRMRQSLAEFEARFHHEAAEAVAEREAVQRETQVRARIRRQERVRKHGSLRFAALVFTILATSVVVTFLMFEALALLIG